MDIKTCNIIYCSPTHNSRDIALAAGSALGSEPRTIDLTRDLSDSVIAIPADEVAVIAVPVYAGRVAPFALGRLRRLRGDATPAILVVTYGNRDYEDALVELHDAMTSQGFVTVAAGAFVGEHSYSRPGMPIGEGRPDSEDVAVARRFGDRAASKLASAESVHEAAVAYVKGNRPYRSVSTPTPTAPHTLDGCVLCGTCADVCPTYAVRVTATGVETDKNLCVKCCACVKECPQKVRIFDTPYTEMLHKNFSSPREPELFF
ncbi:MAG: 4Fe-4S binding protein [Rikenellaceae bacterium]|nr:4Fe-4S binding protein [Rikenellaceae bacterium]